MTPIRPEDRPKMIALGGGVVLVMVFVVMQVSSALNPPKAPEAPKVETVAATPTPAGVASGSLPEAPAPGAGAPIVVATMPMAPQVDPFRQVLPDTGNTSASRSPGPMGGKFVPLTGPVPGLPQPTLASVEVKPYTPGEDGEALGADDLQLKGVLAGNQPVAVFSKGDKDVVVRIGENLNADVTLLEITPIGAVVRAHKKRVVLEIGQAVAAAPAVQAVPAGPGGNAPLLLNGIG